MRALRAWAVVLALWASVALSPAAAHAWTSSSVRTVSAHLVIAPDAGAEVTLVAELRVDGGWLASFEMDGLDPALELAAERPATFEDALGARFTPTVEHRGDGRIVWSFRRRDAPRRGDYVASVTYRTHLATELDGDAVRVLWTLPAWRYGLDDVAITIDAPPGADAAIGDGDEASVSVTRVADVAGERVVLRRVHLPRTREWPIAIVVPAGRMDAALRTPRVVAPPPAPPRAAAAPERPEISIALTTALALLALLAIAVTARADRIARVAPAPAIPLPAWARSIAIVGLAITACAIEDASAPCGVAIAALAIARRAGAPRAPRLGAFRSAASSDLRAARRARVLTAISPLHGGAIAGVIVALAIGCAAPALPIAIERAALLACLAAAIVLSSARRVRPASPLEDLAALEPLARRTRAELDDDRRWAMRLVVHADVRGEIQDARLRIALASTPKGLLRLDVVRAARAERARWTSEPALLVVTREGSPADRALEERFPGTTIDRAPRRVARQLPLTDLATALAPVLETLAACPVDAPLTREAATPGDLAA